MKLSKEKEKEILDQIIYSDRTVNTYRSLLQQYELSNAQIDSIIKTVGPISSALEAKIAEEVLAYLEGLKKPE